MADFGVEKAAEDLANDFVNEKITSAQLRKFYNEFKGFGKENIKTKDARKNI